MERLINRGTCTVLPTTGTPQQRMPHSDQVIKDQTKRQQQQSKYYNQHTGSLPLLQEGDVVRMKPFRLGDRVQKKGTVTARPDEDHTKSRHLTDKATEEKKTRETADIHPDVQDNTPFQSSEHAALTKPP